MAGYNQVKLDGLPEALQGLSGFSKAIQKHHTRVAVSAGGGVLKSGAQRRVTKDSGTLKKNLIVHVKGNKKGTAVYARIGARRGVKVAVQDTGKGLRAVASFTARKGKPTKATGEKRLAKLQATGANIHYRSPSRIAHLVEKGTKRHLVVATKKRRLARTGRFFGTSVEVSAKPKPFLEPTARADGPAAVVKAKQKVKEGIEKERAKAWSIAKKP